MPEAAEMAAAIEGSDGSWSLPLPALHATEVNTKKLSPGAKFSHSLLSSDAYPDFVACLSPFFHAVSNCFRNFVVILSVHKYFPGNLSTERFGTRARFRSSGLTASEETCCATSCLKTSVERQTCATSPL